MKSATVILTSTGGNCVPEIIEHLRHSHRFQLKLVAVDMAADAAAFALADSGYKVPAGNDPSYTEVMIALCGDQGAHIIVPLSDEEAQALADASQEFANLGCTILGSGSTATRLAGDKSGLLAALRKSGVPVPEYYCIQTTDELEPALVALGFPKRRVILKPNHGRGGRGVREVSDNMDEVKIDLELTEDSLFGSHFMLMEYLEGPHYSVDVLIHDGAVRASVTQQKTTAPDGRIISTRIIDEPEINHLVRQITNSVRFDYLINIDMGRRELDGAILPYEINARPSALVSGTNVTGISFMEEALCQALGLETKALSPELSGQVQIMTDENQVAP